MHFKGLQFLVNNRTHNFKDNKNRLHLFSIIILYKVIKLKLGFNII